MKAYENYCIPCNEHILDEMSMYIALSRLQLAQWDSIAIEWPSMWMGDLSNYNPSSTMDEFL